MTQAELEREIAQSTGEDLGEIRRLGFSIVASSEDSFDHEPDDLPAQTLDWDDYQGGIPMPVVSRYDDFLPRRLC